MSDDDKTGEGGKPGKGGPKRGAGAPAGGGKGRGPAGGDRGDRPRRAARPAGSGEPRAFGDKPRKPFAGKREGAGGDAKPGGEGRPFRARGEGGKPFTPKSRGMVSHGGARTEDGKPGRPKSYGRRSHDAAPAGEGEGGERKARPLGAERRNDRWAGGKDGAKGGFRKERPARAGQSDGAERHAGAGKAERFDKRPRRDGGEAAVPADAAGEAALTMRIARRLARAGVASRRDAEAMIAEGRVSVNGKVLETPALDVGPKDRITIDGEVLPTIERTRLWLFHKPAGLVTTNKDPEGRQTVFDKLPAEMPRVLTIGRLDINTEGLLLLTNDGGLARVLELPATGWLRRYRVRAHGTIDQAKLDELRAGIAIDGVFYGAIEATLDREQGSNVWLTLGLREGKNREVKRVLGHLGLDVNRLIRLSYGPFQLADLAEGAVREIHGKTLRDQLGPRLIEEAGADFDAPIVNPFSNKPVEAARTPRAKDGEAKRPRSETAPNKKRQREEQREDALGRLDTRAGRPGRDRGEDRPARAQGAPRPARSEGADRRARPDAAGKPFGDKPQRGRGDGRDGGAGPRSREGSRGDARGPKRFDGDKPARGGFGDKAFGDRKFGDRKFGAGKPGGETDERPMRPVSAGRRLSNVWIAPGGRPMGPKKAAGEEAKAERADKPRAVDPTQRMGKRRTGAKPKGGSAGGFGPKRPRKD
ncbi:pseudouridine synthase [Jiella pacifica]|uniref:Pseudouridine synthase n=1 Tax=Jiella pacifica TaxID=2696469 RepID=A0A6N9SY43_9HYPH|nr:pseudouridine synthase [Jiella pacifica]NDW04013.1 pseudouridine synthase [Jiella pacifica]